MKMLYNEGEVSSALVDVIKKEEELRLRFLGTQAFKDLEEKAKAYEEGHGVQ